LNTPQTSHDATRTRIQMRSELRMLRDDAKQKAKAHADAEHLYKREQAKAFLVVEGSNAKEREANAYLWPLPPDAVEQGAAIAQAGGLGDYRPQQVGDVRWMRDRIKAIADHASAVAYDAKEEFDTFEEELRMVRQERGQEAYGMQETA
jgi:chromosome segregation ATPase